MSEATLVAAEIQDLATTVGEVAAAIREKREQVINVELPAPTLQVTMPEQQPPVVNVSVPQQAAPTVEVSPTPVTVEAKVNVERAEPAAYVVRITERDASGFIQEFVITPIM